MRVLEKFRCLSLEQPRTHRQAEDDECGQGSCAGNLKAVATGLFRLCNRPFRLPGLARPIHH